ncbi:hypothetical protein [Endozoicomonas sp. ALC066]|uniref:hypothetical protein n=1 Tax=Endozoicomonas sp. ALC066 TaxID=3403078 RepID=UPI003BB4B922
MARRFTGKDLQDLFRVEGYQVTETDCKNILRYSTLIDKHNEVECSVPEFLNRKRHQELADDAVKKLTKVMARIHEENPDRPTIKVEINGDPRGYPLKFFFPSERYNSFGGREAGFGICTATPREGW